MAPSMAVALGVPVVVLPAIAAALLLLLGALALFLKSRRAAGVVVHKAARKGEASAMSCPSCLREFPPAMVFCPMDARKLVHAEDAGERRSPGTRCPRCRRAFEAATRFCPFDAEELVPQALWDATQADDPHDHDHGHAGDLLGGAGCGKICPTCAAKYGLDASFCGKDGSELVTVN